MKVYTDSRHFAEGLLPGEVVGGFVRLADPGAAVARLVAALFPEGRPLWHAPPREGPWNHVFLSEFSPGSQYDQLIGLARTRCALPDRVAAVAGSGVGFHGFKGRSWAAVPGNVHLSVHLAPGRPVERHDVAFTVLAVLSVVDAVDTIPELRGRSGIKWVNDVLVDGAKVAGILAYTQADEAAVSSAVLGIGLNVEAAPPVERTPFAPEVGCLSELAGDPGAHERAPTQVRQGPLLEALLDAIDRNYRVLLSRGFAPLLDRYRERSLALEREVTLRSEGPEGSEEGGRVLAKGRVRAVGEGLELYLEGRDEPLRSGRLVLEGLPAASATTDHGQGAYPAL